MAARFLCAKCNLENGAVGISNIEGKIARVATREFGNDRVSNQTRFCRSHHGFSLVPRRRRTFKDCRAESLVSQFGQILKIYGITAFTWCPEMLFMDARNAHITKHWRSKSKTVRVGENGALSMRQIDRQRAGRNPHFRGYDYRHHRCNGEWYDLRRPKSCHDSDSGMALLRNFGLNSCIRHFLYLQIYSCCARQNTRG
jgi:hypothetical protein